MIFKIFAHAIALVVLLALAAHFLGTGIIDAGIHHITSGIEEIAELAKKLAADGTAGSMGKQIKQWLGF